MLKLPMLLLFFLTLAPLVSAQSQTRNEPPDTPDAYIKMTIAKDGKLFGDTKKKSTLSTPKAIKNFLKKRRGELEKQARHKDQPVPKRIGIIIRADKSVPFVRIVNIMQTCRDCGFSASDIKVIVLNKN